MGSEFSAECGFQLNVNPFIYHYPALSAFLYFDFLHYFAVFTFLRKIDFFFETTCLKLTGSVHQLASILC